MTLRYFGPFSENIAAGRTLEFDGLPTDKSKKYSRKGARELASKAAAFDRERDANRGTRKKKKKRTSSDKIMMHLTAMSGEKNATAVHEAKLFCITQSSEHHIKMMEIYTKRNDNEGFAREEAAYQHNMRKKFEVEADMELMIAECKKIKETKKKRTMAEALNSYADSDSEFATDSD